MNAPVHYPAAGTALLRPLAGRVGSQEWLDIARLSAEFADGTIYLPGHSAFELRGITDSAAFEDAVAGTGLNATTCAVLASPLSPRARSLAASVAAELADAAPDLVVGIDDGDGRIAGRGLDAGAIAVDDAHVELIIGGARTGQVLDDAAVPGAIAAALGDAGTAGIERETLNPADGPIGWLPTAGDRVHLGAGIPAMPAPYAEMVGRMEIDGMLTAWRGVVFYDLPEGDAEVVIRFLAPRGFVFDVNAV